MYAPLCIALPPTLPIERDGSIHLKAPFAVRVCQHKDRRRTLTDILTPRKEKVWTTFDRDQFVVDCRSALAADRSHKLVREVVKRAVADPAAILKALGEPKRAALQTLYRSDELTVLNIVWGPNMVLLPHDHRMWAVIGIYSGREDNIFWRRPPGRNGKLEAVGAKALSERDAEPLGHNIIHSVINPIPD